MKQRLTVNTLALGNLKKRKKQYTSLILGIILAMVFSSSVLLMVSSMVESTRKMEQDTYGKQNGIYLNATRQMFADAAGKKAVDEYAFATVLGQAVSESGVHYPAAVYDDACAALANIEFTQGAYPQKENEIAMESATMAKLGIKANVGDSVTLDFAVQNGADSFEKTEEKTFVLSGIAQNKASNIATISTTYGFAPSVFLAQGMTVEPGGKAQLVCYFTYSEESLKLNQSGYTVFSDYLESAGYDPSNWIPADGNMFAGNASGNGIYTASMFIIFFVCVLLGASCLGIVNAFSNNLNERRQQIGMLRTVGATKRQIVLIFGREAFLISLICAPISVALSCLIVKTGLLILGERFVFAANIWVLLLSVAVGVACVMLAALIPLLKAANVTPVQTVRNIGMTRRAVRRKIKSKKLYDPSKLIAQRSLFFNGKAKAAASLILVITIVGSCYGFSVLDEINSQKFSARYEYELQYSDSNVSYINFTGGNSGYTDSHLGAVRSIPYAGDIRVSKYCKAFLLADTYTEYQKAALYSDNIFWSFKDINFARQATAETIDTVMQENYSEDYINMRNYCGGGDILPVPVVALDSSAVAELGDYLDSGDIDISALDSGREAIVIAPREIGVYSESDSDGGFMWGTDLDAQITADKSYLKRAERDLEVGQSLDFAVVSSSEESPAEGMYSIDTDQDDAENTAAPDFSSLRKTDFSVEIGALVSELPQDFYEECGGISNGRIVVVTTLDGMKHLYDTDCYSNINFNLSTKCTDEIDAEITQTLQDIVDSIDGIDDSFTSYYTVTSHEKQQNAALLVSLLAILVLFLSICASIINNSLTAQIREGRREIGTLRAVGASVRELFRSYVRQLLWVFAVSYAAGFGLFAVSYFIARAVIVNSEYYEWFLKFNIWQTGIACVVLFAVCAANLWLKIRKEMKHSVIDNIREL